MATPVGIRAAWILGLCTILGAVIYGIFVFLSPQEPSSSVSVGGDSKGNIAVVDKARDVTINQSTGDTVEEQITGYLMPANDPDPPHTCGDIPAGAIKVFLGSDMAWFGAEKVKQVVVRMGDMDVLWLERTRNGAFISAALYREDSREVAKIVNNEFKVNPGNYFKPPLHPDRHTLTVVDKNDRRVLYVRFLNETTFLFEGILCAPGRPCLVASEEYNQYGKDRSRRVCVRGGRFAFIFE